MNILINGTGRIGRILLRLIIQNKRFENVYVNDPNFNIHSLEYLLKFDSIYGKLKYKISRSKSFLKINGIKLIFTDKKNIYLQKYLKKIHIIVDSSGIKLNHENILKISKKEKKNFLITHTFNKADYHHIFGINKSKSMKNKKVISCSICDAVASGPIINMIENRYKIVKGNLLTLHPWLSYQNLNDGISRSYAYPGKIIENFALGRASTEGLIPKKTSCIDALKYFIPKISKKFDSLSVRVPTPVVSAAIINIETKNKMTNENFYKNINILIKQYNEKIIQLNDDQIISKDVLANPYSAVLDKRWTQIKKNKSRIFLWYDNEFGYASRVNDLIEYLI